jgi:N-acetylmuramoyl-L-alanine amidase
MRRIVAGILVCLLLPSLAWAGGELRAVRLSENQGKTRVVLDLSRSAEAKLMTMRDPHRLVIDIPGFKMSPKAGLDGGLGLVTGVRAANQANGDLRVVLDLSAAASARDSRLAPSGEYGHRLVFDLFSSDLLTARKKAADVPGRGRSVVVAIDAGHGGKDPGATGRKGTKEKDVVLAIARKLAKRVNEQPGMKAVLTRDGDRYLNLRERMDKARKHGADLFISIHADAVGSSQPRGASVYVVSERGATSEAARLLAERENAADLVGGVKLANREDMVAYTLLDLSQDVSITRSMEVGAEVLEEMGKMAKLHRSDVQQAGFVVLKSPDIPSILVETAFISNPTDESNLRSSNYQATLAEAVLRGVVDFFNKAPPDGTLLAQNGPQRVRGGSSVRHQEYVIARGDTLSEIASRYNVSLTHLRSANGLRSDRIRVGQVLRIPTG